jgi:5-methylcytosine-specific restriction enzyme subunit McrC
VRVLDAVGIIATSTLELEVKPKIPQDHLLYLLSRAQLAPNFLRDRAHLRRDRSLTEVLAQWFVSALERLLQEGLARDYRPVRDEISYVRGRIVPLASASLYYRGQLSVVADFEEFDFDTPLNRTLREAARVVLSTPIFDSELRRRASRAIARMDGVGQLRPDDLRA